MDTIKNNTIQSEIPRNEKFKDFLFKTVFFSVTFKTVRLMFSLWKKNSSNLMPYTVLTTYLFLHVISSPFNPLQNSSCIRDLSVIFFHPYILRLWNVSVLSGNWINMCRWIQNWIILTGEQLKFILEFWPRWNRK